MDLNSQQREYIFDWEILLEADIKLTDKEVIHAQFTKVYLDDTEQWTDLGERITGILITDSPSTVSDPSGGITYSNERIEDNKSSEEEELDQEAMDRLAMGLPASFGVTPKTKKRAAAPSASKKRRFDKDKSPPKDFEFETYWKKYGKIFTAGIEELSAHESGADISETKFAKTLCDTKELFRDHKNVEFFREFLPGKPAPSEGKAVETPKMENVKELIRRDMMNKSLIAARNRAETFAKKLHQFSFVNGFNIGSKNEDGVFERSKTAKEILSPFEDVNYTLHEPVYYGKMKRKNYSMHPIDFDIDAPAEAEPILLIKEESDPKNFDFSFDPVRDARLLAKNAFKIFGPNTSLIKYWHQRYRLFSKLNDGILMDEEGWFSVTPEIIAKHIADRMVTHKDCVILDAFTGVGGNAIQFALKGALVYAIDLDPIKLRCARQNAKVYGVDDRITFICGNFYHIAKSFCQSRPNGKPLFIDSIFLSPPWGGPEYLNKPLFELGSCVPDGFEIFDIAVKISQNIAYFLPRNTSSNQLMQIAAKTTMKKVEIEHNVLNNKIKALTAYYGNLVSTS